MLKFGNITNSIVFAEKWVQIGGKFDGYLCEKFGKLCGI